MNGAVFLNEVHKQITTRLNIVLDAFPVDEPLITAMRYVLLSGNSKRIRPALVLASAALFDVPFQTALPAACAIECIHTYSLVHDDLPAMDDDDLRRGLPACHIAFDEATAILVGDALQSLAFELLADESDNSGLSASRRVQLIATLAKASGAQGMALGQALDLAAEHKVIALSELMRLHRLKTGALIQASVRMGALCAAHQDSEILSIMDELGAHLGIAFQIQDDILDIESSTETLGKPQGSDAAKFKSTYPQLVGLDSAKQQAADYYERAVGLLSPWGDRADPLRELIEGVVKRVF